MEQVRRKSGALVEQLPVRLFCYRWRRPVTPINPSGDGDTMSHGYTIVQRVESLLGRVAPPTQPITTSREALERPT